MDARPDAFGAPVQEMPEKSTFQERWLNFRNGLIASPRFQRWAASFPLTRPTAHNNTRALFDIVAGFVYSQVLSACVQLHLFDILSEGPQAISALSVRFALSDPATERLLKAAAALGLTERLPDGRFALGQLGAALRGNPSVTAMIEHHAMLYADLADPVALLRGDVTDAKLKNFWAYAKNDNAASVPDDRARDYSALMSASQALVACDVLDAYPMKRHRRLLDIGGGEGVFLTEAGKRIPNLNLMLFDLPAVVTRAKARFDAAGLAARATVFGGDFFADSLPTGADIVSLVRVLHDHDDGPALAILRKAYAALQHGGTLLIAEPMSGTSGAEPIGDAYFGFYLAAMGSGRPRTLEEITQMALQAGFRTVRTVPTRTPLIVRVLLASA
jgi:demethylspheroidene O-methyltransferase